MNSISYVFTFPFISPTVYVVLMENSHVLCLGARIQSYFVLEAFEFFLGHAEASYTAVQQCPQLGKPYSDLPRFQSCPFPGPSSLPWSRHLLSDLLLD